MGGMSTASLLAKDGYKVLVLEAGFHPGGCSSSYPRKKFVFEAGATTLMGFDEHQPLRYLEEKTGVQIPRTELNPSMSVYLDGEKIIRYKEREAWINEAARVFGDEDGQRKFWELAFRISDTVWSVSLKNSYFPPVNMADWLKLFTTNNPLDVWVLPYANKSVKDVASQFQISSAKFLQFLDEQLMITAQNTSDDVPFLFGALGLTYPNYSNYSVPGGLMGLIHPLKELIEQEGGELHTKEAVLRVVKEQKGYSIHTKKDKVYTAEIVVSNVPVWNLPDLTEGKIREYFEGESKKFDKAWAALTVGIAVEDHFDSGMEAHHQVHLPEGEAIPFTDSHSLFVSISPTYDESRAPEGFRALNVSCHANPDVWFEMEDAYEENKQKVLEFIIDMLDSQLPGFKKTAVQFADLATPPSWESWVGRKKGRVGGIPQSMARGLLNWTPHQTPFNGLYLVGDTTYPGQGIPGVTLGGISVYSRIKKNHPNTVSA